MPRTVELRTHQFQVFFQDGTRAKIYSEDEVAHLAPSDKEPVIDGSQRLLDRLSKPGVLAITPDTWKPHFNIHAIKLLDSPVTKVAVVEFDDTHKMWKILEED